MNTIFTKHRHQTAICTTVDIHALQYVQIKFSFMFLRSVFLSFNGPKYFHQTNKQWTVPGAGTRTTPKIFGVQFGTIVCSYDRKSTNELLLLTLGNNWFSNPSICGQVLQKARWHHVGGNKWLTTVSCQNYFVFKSVWFCLQVQFTLINAPGRGLSI